MSFFRQFAAPVVLTVFGTVSTLGTGLHLFPGCNHFHAPARSGTAHTSCATHGQCCHDQIERAECAIAPTDDCEICRVLAIPRLVSPPPAIIAFGIHFEPLIVAVPLQPTLEKERPYGARAPPSEA
jgi:hypothetical protein